MGTGPSGGGGPSYVYDLALDDNAANTSVVNAGTGGLVTASDNTDTLHSATRQEGSGSFLFDGPPYSYIRTNDNWTSEKFELKFYLRHNADGGGVQSAYFSIGPGDLTVGDNTIALYTNGGATLKIALKGNGGTSKTLTATNYTYDQTTFHLITLTVDASAVPWVVTLKQDATIITWDSDLSIYPDQPAVFNNYLHWGGDPPSTYSPRSFIDKITVEDKT